MPTTISGKYRYDTGPLTTVFSSFSAYSLEDEWRSEYQSETGIDLMMVEGQKKLTTKGSKVLYEGYLAGGEGYGDESYLVVMLTDANASSIIEYVVKSRTELGDDFYTYCSAFRGEMTDEIWNTMQGWFNTTLIVSTSSGTITISDGEQNILVNASTHAMRYNADYYDWTSNTSTEYSTISTNGWLVDGTYTYQGVNQDWNTIIDSLKAKGIVNATITHDTVNGEITMTNGPWSFTIMDKNLGATQVYNDGDTLSETNCGTYFQWGNNNGFAWTGSVTTSSTQVDTTGYGPGNYYTGTDFITKADWSSPSNDDLWGNVTNTEYARQGPAPSGYHVPSIIEWQNFIKFFNIIRPNAHSGNDFKNAFKLPFDGIRRYTDSGVVGQGNNGFYWSSSSQSDSYNTYNLMLDSLNVYASSNYYRAYGLPVRPFKNTYTLIPINNLWTGDETSTAAIMNQHPYDYYLLGGCESVLRLLSDGTMHNVYASYDSNTNTRSVSEVW